MLGVSAVQKSPEAKVEPYDQWVSDPSPENLKGVVDSLEPTINYSLSQVGAVNDPYMRAKARKLAAESVHTYTPGTSALPTWATQQLLQLKRLSRQSNPSMRIPEKAQLDNLAISNAEAEFLDKHDRYPDLDELSDGVRLSKRRIQDVRKMARSVPSESALQGATVDPQEPDFYDEALDYVYADLDATDKRILEMKTGYGGKYEPMEAAAIAAEVGIHPSNLTRRSARIALKINEVENGLQATS